jgi:hypothetical protein
LFFSGNPSAGAAYIGDLDEVILYQGWAAASVHQDWYRQGKTPVSTRAIPAQLPAADLIAGMDKREFAPGHPQVSLTPVEQLQRFPLPRYQPGHQLPRLYNWMALDFMGGLTQPGITRDMARRNSVAVQEELITHWHYMLILHNVGTFHGDRYLRDTTTFQQAWIEQANRHPEVPLAVTTFWAQTPLTLLGEKERTPYVLRSTMPDNYYLRSTQGKYLNTRGEPTDKALLVSPAAPEELFRKDGESVKICFEDLLEVLTRPIDMINENGEVRPIPLDSAVAVKDSRVATHYKASGIRDWKTYETRQRNRLYEAYKAPFMSLPGLKGTTFTLYGTDGGPLDRYTWTEARKVQTPIRGQYYATPDFYPRWPDNWRMWKGPWRGWEWLDISRKVEMAAGDTFFSPFIAAGWSRTEADNVRPSQWLGLVKHLGVIGAPFYYTGFFNEGRAGDTYADPKNYVWQAAIPAYAQAITSRYESLLWKGDVLRDVQGKPIITWETGDPRILVTVRKDASAPRYIICGNINPNTNIAGNVPDTAPTRIILGQDTIRFEVRRQGSVYLLDLSQPQAPVFYQVDTWHEAGHPIWWSENFQVEAEVWDAARGATRHTLRPAGVRPGDFRQWTTYVRLDPAGGQVSTTLTSRKPVTHAQWTGTLRGTGRKKTALEILVNGTTVGKISKIKHTDWKTVTLSLSGLSLTANTPFEVTLRASGGAVEVDNWVLKPQ